MGLFRLTEMHFGASSARRQNGLSMLSEKGEQVILGPGFGPNDWPAIEPAWDPLDSDAKARLGAQQSYTRVLGEIRKHTDNNPGGLVENGAFRVASMVRRNVYAALVAKLPQDKSTKGAAELLARLPEVKLPKAQQELVEEKTAECLEILEAGAMEAAPEADDFDPMTDRPQDRPEFKDAEPVADPETFAGVQAAARRGPKKQRAADSEI